MKIQARPSCCVLDRCIEDLVAETHTHSLGDLRYKRTYVCLHAIIHTFINSDLPTYLPVGQERQVTIHPALRATD